MTINENLDALSFWRWIEFKLNSGQIDDIFFAELDKKLSYFGFDSWEFGPFPSGGDYLAISPAGSRERLKDCQNFIKNAPNITGWKFLPAKPAKQWNRIFEWSRSGDRICAIDWKFNMYSYPDGMHEIVLIKDSMGKLDKKNKLSILEFVIDSEIGEEKSIEKICKFDVSDNPNESDLSQCMDLDGVKAAIDR